MFPGQRILCLTHVKELIRQNYLELTGYWLDAPAGIYSAGLNRRDTEHPVIFASIQSVYRRAHELGRFDLVLIDECHLVPVKTSEGMYRKMLDDMKGFNPHLKVIGLSATPYRLDNGMLNEGDSRLYTDIITAKHLGMSIDDLMEQGYLAPLVTPDGGVETRLNTEGVGKQGGDFIQSQLAEAVDVHSVTQAACREIVKFGEDRKHWLVFASSIAHAEHICEELNVLGIEADVVVSNRSRAERDAVVEKFKRGGLRCLVNVNVLTTGFDYKAIDLLAFMRPTMSTSLYMQMAGRGMRIHPSKTDCLVLDFAGNISRHGPVNDVTPPKHRKKKEKGEAPQKECESCFWLCHASVQYCPKCGWEFPINTAPKIDDTPSELDIIQSKIAKLEKKYQPPEKYEITNADYDPHFKSGKPTSVKVSYWCGMRKIATEYVCLHHGGGAQARAKQWWREHMGDHPYPIRDRHQDARAAVPLMEAHALIPEYLYVDESGKYPRIVSKGALVERDRSLDRGVNYVEPPSDNDLAAIYDFDDEIPF